MIPFSDFKGLGRTPRYPDDGQITKTLSELTPQQYNQSLLVFISHCWLRGWPGADGWDGRAHPDNAEQDKYKLCCEGIEQVMKRMAPGMEECYIWLDYGCIDQDGEPAGELRMLNEIVKVCDCIFTPIYDPNHQTWEMPAAGNLYEVYKSPGWNGGAHSYLNRAWCRVEMLYAANIPLIEDTKERRGRLAAGLLYHRSEGRRPHLLFGSKEVALRPPLILPPLQNSFLDDYNPESGNLTKEKDRETLRQLMKELQPYIKRVTEGYEGETKAGKRHGMGTYTYANGAAYEGEWTDGKKHGKGKFTYAGGAVYEGEWKDGNKHGKGKYTYASGNVYEGEWKDDMMHGMGKFTYGGGNVYEGEWKDGRRHGKGKCTFASGNIYEGEWHDDKMDGIGKLAYACGDIHEGEWKDGKRHGKGKYTYASGNVYDGEWKDDMMHGVGKLAYAGGDLYEGEWKDGRRHGKGKCTFASGNIYEGEWHEDKMDGMGKLAYACGDIHEGEWKDGKRHGKGKCTFVSGNVYDGEWHDDKMHGVGKLAYAGGDLYEGEWKDGKAHGEGILFAGGVRKRIKYEKDVISFLEVLQPSSEAKRSCIVC